MPSRSLLQAMRNRFRPARTRRANEDFGDHTTFRVAPVYIVPQTDTKLRASYHDPSRTSVAIDCRSFFGDADTAWSLGTFGAIAEFTRDASRRHRVVADIRDQVELLGQLILQLEPAGVVSPFRIRRKKRLVERYWIDNAARIGA